MARIIITAFVDNKLKSLIEVLYLKGYFGFKESAYDYVNKLYDFIDIIPEQTARPCKNAKYGKYYVVFKMNSSTTYYISFDFANDLYLIKNIFNNHSEEYPKFIKIDLFLFIQHRKMFLFDATIQNLFIVKHKMPPEKSNRHFVINNYLFTHPP